MLLSEYVGSKGNGGSIFFGGGERGCTQEIITGSQLGNFLGYFLNTQGNPKLGKVRQFPNRKLGYFLNPNKGFLPNLGINRYEKEIWNLGFSSSIWEFSGS